MLIPPVSGSLRTSLAWPCNGEHSGSSTGSIACPESSKWRIAKLCTVIATVSALRIQASDHLHIALKQTLSPMAAIVQFFLNTAKTAMSVLNSTPPLSVPESESSPPFQHPSPKDVLLVKTVMLKKLRLPLEIVDTIIDWAEYWPCTTVTTRGETSARGGLENREDELIVSMRPLFILPFLIGRYFKLVKALC